jgi:hypothetical protein
MIRKIAMVATATAVALGGVAVASGTAFAAKPTITATGNASCSISGKLKISPPLTNVNTAPSLTSGKLKGTCTGSSEVGQTSKGPVNVTPTAAKAALSIQGTDAGTCTGLTAPEPGGANVNVTIAWKASGGKINPTNISFPAYTVNGITFVLSGGTATGSYASNNASGTGVPDIGALAAALATCDPNEKGKVKGVKKITLTSGSLTLP